MSNDILIHIEAIHIEAIEQELERLNRMVMMQTQDDLSGQAVPERPNTHRLGEPPWMKFSGVFKNDPDFAAIVRAMREEREIDADSPAYSLDDIA